MFLHIWPLVLNIYLNKTFSAPAKTSFRVTLDALTTRINCSKHDISKVFLVCGFFGSFLRENEMFSSKQRVAA